MDWGTWFAEMVSMPEPTETLSSKDPYSVLQQTECSICNCIVQITLLIDGKIWVLKKQKINGINFTKKQSS